MRSTLFVLSAALLGAGCPAPGGLLLPSPGDGEAPRSPMAIEAGDFESTLPLLLIDTRGEDVDADELWDDQGGREWAEVDIVTILPGDGVSRLDGPQGHWGLAGLHVRGSSSAGFEKKSYSLETWDSDGEDHDVELFGLPSEEDWVLQGPFSDKTLLRNYLAYRWSNAIGRYAARTVFIEVFLTDDGGVLDESDYRGVYVLTEKVKRGPDRVDLEELSFDDDPSGGYLLRRDRYDEGDMDRVFGTPGCGDELFVADPKDATAEQVGWVADWYIETEEALLHGPPEAWADRIDVDSFIDHHLLVELTKNVDGLVLSTFIEKDRGDRLRMGPIWDYNIALGNIDYTDAWLTSGWQHDNPEFPDYGQPAWCWYERMFEDVGFDARNRELWSEHRAGPWSTDRLLADIDDAVELLGPAVDRNFERWPILDEYVWPNDPGFDERSSYEEEIDYLEGWVSERVEWMDSAL